MPDVELSYLVFPLFGLSEIYWGLWLRLKRNVLIKLEGKPPDLLAFVESG